MRFNLEYMRTQKKLSFGFGLETHIKRVWNSKPIPIQSIIVLTFKPKTKPKPKFFSELSCMLFGKQHFKYYTSINIFLKNSDSEIRLDSQ